MDTLTEQMTETEPLKVADRCDHGGCQAQAFVRANLITGEILFCGHHFAKAEPVLVTQAMSIDDFRHLINERASASSA